MVQLVASDIKTRDVLDWRGVHLLHFVTSSCSQKTRIVLALKGVEWQSHPVDLRTQVNMTDWFLGINPRGLVPVLVHDGAVHIESNDIVTYLDRNFRGPKLIPAGKEAEIARLLHEEDDLHLDLRTLTMRFVMPARMAMKPPEAIARYEAGGSGQVAGVADTRKPIEINFWKNLATVGITDEDGVRSAGKFRRAYDELDGRLARHEYLLGDDLSLLDIAWYIYTNRLSLANYPLASYHPRIATWFAKLKARPEFAAEVALPPPAREAIEAHQKDQTAQGTSLAQVLARA